MTDEIRELILCAGDLRADGKYEEASREYRLAEDAALRGLQAHALEGLVEVDIRQERFAEALETTGIVLGLWEEVGDPRRRAQALQKRAEILTAMDRWLDARSAWRAARPALHHLGDPWAIVRCDSRIAELTDKIYKQARDERRAGEVTDPRRRLLLGRRWLR